MTFGFTVLGSHGLVQVTDQFSNLLFQQKVLATMGASNGSSVRCQVSVAGQMPFVAINSSFPVSLVGSSSSGGTWTFEFMGPPASAGASFWVYVFDLPMGQTNTHVGVQVFRPDGALAFDSGAPYLKIAALGAVPAGSPGFSQTWELNSLPSGTYAVLSTFFRSGVYAIPGSNTLWCMDGVYTLSTGAGIRLYPYGQKGIWDQGDGSGLTIDTSNSPQLVILDVSLM